MLRSEARVIAEEPRLKAVTSAEDVGRDTLVGVALELHQATASDLFVLTDSSGKLILDAADPEQSGHDLKSHDVVRDALARGDASGVWTSGQSAYQVQARRLEFGETPFGVLVIGTLARAEARRLARAPARCGRRARARRLAARDFSRPREIARTRGDAPALATLPSGGVHEISVGDARYLAVAGALPGYSGQRKLRYALLRSLDVALAPSLRLRSLLFWIAAAALLVSVVATGVLSTRLSRPLEALAGLTRRFAKGDLSARATPEGPHETRVLAHSLNRMAADLERTQRSLREKDRLDRELEIAERIQTALLPDIQRVSRLEIAARMLPAATVGGDYYDVHPAPGGAWIGIGDVAGHGLTAGLVMLMVQSGTASLVRALPAARPSELVNLLNGVVYSNVHERLKESEHVTFSLLRYYEDGRIVHAGAHEDMIVYRAREKRCEIVRSRGMWLSALPDIEHSTVDSEFRLETGDLLVLYSDGVTEALNEEHAMYGLEGITKKLVELANEPVADICDAILADVRAYSSQQIDDRTLVVARQGAASGTLRAAARPSRLMSPAFARKLPPAETMPNHLANETSPYLLLHAHNPVDWYAWGRRSARARAPRGQADLSQHRLRGVPLVPRHGARELRKRSGREALERALREHQGRSRRASRSRRDLHDRDGGAVRQRRLAHDRVSDAGARAVFRRHLLPADRQVRPSGVSHAARAHRRALENETRRAREAGGGAHAPRAWRLRASAGGEHSGRRHRSKRCARSPRASTRVGAASVRRRNFRPLRRCSCSLATTIETRRALVAPAQRHARRHEERGNVRSGRRRLRALLDGRALARAALREDALRQRRALPRLPRSLSAHGQPGVSPSRAARRSTTSCARCKATDGGYFSATDADSEGEEGKFFVWGLDEIQALLERDAAERFAFFLRRDGGGQLGGEERALAAPNARGSGALARRETRSARSVARRARARRSTPRAENACRRCSTTR